ncbi:MAG: hypothetical protein ACRDUA_07255, partial [Micromonosporaceae bacterium]
MGSIRRQQYYCRCGTRLARDNTQRQCARCQHQTRDKLISPPEVPAEFWDTEQFEEAFAARHMGRVSRAYRTHPHHYAVYGPYGISQTLLGQWLNLRQPQVSRYETGPALQLLDTLQHWARVLRIPPELLWFRLPEDTTPLTGTETNGNGLAVQRHTGRVTPAGPPATRGATSERTAETEPDPVLVTPWNHRGTVEVAILLSSGGGRVKRRGFLALAGPALTAPA